MVNKVKIKICGKEYMLSSEDSPEYTKKLAEVLDKRIRSLGSKVSGMSITDCAVLTALDCLDELTKLNQNIDNIRSQIKDYVDDASRARNQAAAAQREVKQLQERVAALEKELSERTNFDMAPSTDPEDSMSAKDMLDRDILAAISKPVKPEGEQ